MSIKKEFFIILLICLSVLGYHQAKATDAVKQSIAKVKVDTASVAKTTDIPSETNTPSDEDFAPGLLLVVSLALASVTHYGNIPCCINRSFTFYITTDCFWCCFYVDINWVTSKISY